MAEGAGSSFEDAVPPLTVSTHPKKHHHEDYNDSFKTLFADDDSTPSGVSPDVPETPAKMPWHGVPNKPFCAFDLEAMQKCAARLGTTCLVEEEEDSEDQFSDGDQMEPHMIRPFKAARKLKGHRLFIRRFTARRAHKHAAKVQEGGWYKARPISHGTYGPYGFEP